MRRVVITGIGLVTPVGNDRETTWQALLAGKSGVRRIQSFDPSGFACQVGGEVPAYKIGEFVPKSYRKATKVMEPMQPGDVPITFADVGDLEREFGFRPGTSIEDGLARMVEWYRAFYPSR